MSGRSANTVFSTLEGWALVVGQPALVFFVLALYYLQTRTGRTSDIDLPVWGANGRRFPVVDADPEHAGIGEG
jgi:hypothetical protein